MVTSKTWPLSVTPSVLPPSKHHSLSWASPLLIACQVPLSSRLISAPQHLSYSEAEIRQEAVKLPRSCGQPEDGPIIHNCRAFRKTLLDGLSSNNGWGSGNHPQKPGFARHRVKRLIVTLMAADHKLIHFKSSSTSKLLWIKQDTHPLENCCGMFH